MKSCVTISLVPETRGGPFVLTAPLEVALAHASDLGFDAVEIFAPNPDALPTWLLPRLRGMNMSLSALGTGAGWLLHRWSLSAEDELIRQKAVTFVKSFISRAALSGSMVIIGSMQGGADCNQQRAPTLEHLAESMRQLNDFAQNSGVTLLLEPLNRDETNLLNTIADTREFLEAHGLDQIQILADLYHMGREEPSVTAAILCAGDRLGHVHFVGPTRAPVALHDPHILQIMDALRTIGYVGYLSAEARPVPDSLTAAQNAIHAFRYFMGSLR